MEAELPLPQAALRDMRTQVGSSVGAHRGTVAQVGGQQPGSPRFPPELGGVAPW